MYWTSYLSIENVFNFRKYIPILPLLFFYSTGNWKSLSEVKPERCGTLGKAKCGGRGTLSWNGKDK